jgi:hypothetical protein
LGESRAPAAGRENLTHLVRRCDSLLHDNYLSHE